MCRQVHRELTRNELRDLATIVPATACKQRNYVGTYSRYSDNDPIHIKHPLEKNLDIFLEGFLS